MARPPGRALLVLLLALAPAAAAQDTIPAPPRDTARVPIPPEAVRADTLPDKPEDAPTDTVPPDSALPAPNFPVFPAPGPTGFGPGVWEFGPAELGRWHGLTLDDFFDRIPGLVLTRAGSPGRQQGAAPFGAGGGRVRIYLDGWELRAMNGGTADLQRVPVADVASLRIERRLGEVRVDVTTFRQPDRRPFAQLEGADGDYETRILRPFFASAIGPRLGLQLGLDLIETAGFRRAEDFGASTPFARLVYQLGADRALQLDYRGTAWSLDRAEFAGNQVPGEQLDRGELIVRGRGRFGRLWVDAALGRSSQAPAEGDTLVPDLTSTQAYLRGAIELRAASLVGTARLHRGEAGSWAPDEQEIGLAAHVRPVSGLAAGGDVRHRTRGGEGGLEVEGWARAALVGGLAAFGSVATGERPVPFARDSVRRVRTIGGGGGLPGIPADTTVAVRLFRDVLPSLRAFRAGGEFTRGTVSIGAAYVLHELDRVAPYGTYYDAGLEPVDGGTVAAVEGYGSLPLPLEGLRVVGWFMTRLDDGSRPYLPRHLGWGVLEFHDVFRGGNLEPTLRLEVSGRSRAPLPGAAPGGGGEAPRYVIANAFVQIRILDIRIFWRMDNAFNNRSAADLSGTRLPGARQLYGVRWFFRN